MAPFRFDESEPMKPMTPMAPMQPMQPLAPMHTSAADRWWPADLGQPSSSGAANDIRYAYFADRHRLALHDGGRTRLFDTGTRHIEGFAQSQGGERSLRFATAGGSVGLDALKEL